MASPLPVFWTGANAVVTAGGVGKAVAFARMANSYSNNSEASAVRLPPPASAALERGKR
jgi:hypothetical protein